MKKIFIICFSIFLLSCTSEDSEVLENFNIKSENEIVPFDSKILVYIVKICLISVHLSTHLFASLQ